MSCDEGPPCYRVAWLVDTSTVQQDVVVRLEEGQGLAVVSDHSANAFDLGCVAIIPGLVNAHTHLEFSQLHQPIPTRGRFTDWIRSVVAYRREHPNVTAEAICQGFAESLRCGTTLIGDIATSGWSPADYSAAGFVGVVFQELIGLSPERIASQMELAARYSADVPSLSTSFGLSPHAPYSVHRELFQSTVQRTKQSSRAIAMHLAETESELELLADGTGEFREMLTDFGLWREGLFGDGRRPLDYLVQLAECSRSLVVHGNYLADDELQFLAARPQMTLVFCPRTHAAFGHQDHPWQRVLELGGSVAIGTDSRASNPDLSLFAELQFLAAQHPEISHLSLLKLGSEAGRVALTANDHHSDGANFTIVALSDGGAGDPARSLFSAGNRVVGTIINGRWRFADEQFFGARGVDPLNLPVSQFRPTDRT